MSIRSSEQARRTVMISNKRAVIGLLGFFGFVVCAVMVTASPDERQNGASGLVREVRMATRDFFDPSAAIDAGYGSAGSCVSGPQEGAMGIHYPNGALVGDGMLDPKKPEILIYEQRNGRLRLLGVEFIVIAEAWDDAHDGPPVLLGQHFHYVGSPNRYGLPAFYELHVWAWRNNPSGMFVDWNPTVSCEEYAGEPMGHSVATHGVGH
jgi:hypothetical protein